MENNMMGNEVMERTEGLMDRISSISQQSTLLLYQEVENFVKAELDKREMLIKNYIDDKFIKSEKMVEIQLKKVNNKLYNLDEQLVQTKDKADVSYKRTNTLSFTGRSLKLKKAVHSKVYQVNAPKGTLECTLFHGKLVAQIYSKLYEFYDVSKYGLIPDDSFEECINMINRWRPDINYKKKIMSDYTKQINENGSLPITYEKAYHALLNKTGGNF